MILPQFETDVVFVGAKGPTARPAAILPGSFNPIHAGHWGLAEVASRMLRLPVDLELSLANVDKPLLSEEVVERRVAAIGGRLGIWLTRAPTFLQKARLFPGVVFVVGVDTAERVLSPRYYEGNQEKLLRALKDIKDFECRFLVAARTGPEGRLVSLDDLTVPSGAVDLFEPIPVAMFRSDICSTQLRNQPKP
jgi:hypothetical protein